MSYQRQIKEEAATLLSNFTDTSSIKEPLISEVKMSDILKLIRSNQFILVILHKEITKIQDRIEKIWDKIVQMEQTYETSSPNKEMDELIKSFENLKASDEGVTQKLEAIDQKVKSLQVTPKAQPNFGWTRNKADISFLWPNGL